MRLVICWTAGSSSAIRIISLPFSADDGRDQWHHQERWGKGKADHGSHLSRPAIVEHRLFLRPYVYDIRTGRGSK